jgi:hypothetical protein
MLRLSSRSLRHEWAQKEKGKSSLQMWDSNISKPGGMLDWTFCNILITTCDILIDRRSKVFFKSIDAIKEIDEPTSVHQEKALTKEEYELNLITFKTT